jgi:CBS domain-containing protein
MQFTVRDWMVDVIVFVDPNATVSEALALMRRRYIHSVIVNKTAESPHYGILTSTDICDKIVARQLNPNETRVSEVMTAPLITVKPDMSLKDCANVMKTNHIHHLPVENEAGAIMGMISATDFLVAAEAMGANPGERIT